jgi:hypothetical protein
MKPIYASPEVVEALKLERALNGVPELKYLSGKYHWFDGKVAFEAEAHDVIDSLLNIIVVGDHG